MSQTGAIPQIWDARKNVKRDALNRSSVKSSEPRFLATHLLHRFNASRFFAGHVARHGLGARADAHFFVDMFEMAAHRLNADEIQAVLLKLRFSG
jgi:hypothetical protein